VFAIKVEESDTFDVNGCQNSWLNIVRRVKTHYNGTFQARKCFFFWVHLVFFWGKFSFISSSILINTKNGFLTQTLQHNSCDLSLIVFFQQIFMYSHNYVYLNEKPHPNVFS
jgi:hypothetical protein